MAKVLVPLLLILFSVAASGVPVSGPSVGVYGGAVGAASDSFTTWNAPAGTDPVADSATDTINLTAGANMTITGDATTDTITLAVTGLLASTDINTSAKLLAIVADATGTGLAVFGTSPTITTPIFSGAMDLAGGAVNDDDCTGQQGEWWWDSTDSAIEWCPGNSGVPVSITQTAAGTQQLTLACDETAATGECYTDHEHNTNAPGNPASGSTREYYDANGDKVFRTSAGATVGLHEYLDQDEDGVPEVDADGTTVSIDYDDDGVAEFTFSATGLALEDLDATGNNLATVFDHDTDVTPDPTCANKGVAGKLTLLDVDESAADSWMACDGTSELGPVSLKRWNYVSANSAVAEDAECLAAFNRSDDAEVCTAANLILGHGIPVTGAFVHRIFCAVGGLTGTTDAGDQTVFHFISANADANDGSLALNSTCAATVDLDPLAGVHDIAFSTGGDCGGEVLDQTGDTMLGVRVEWTDANSSITTVDLQCGVEYWMP
jgi:hypothetical protein